MPTQIEMETLTAVKNAARAIASPTREHKRYEIAKECLAGMLGSPNHGQYDWEMCVDLSVKCADALLAKLSEK